MCGYWWYKQAKSLKHTYSPYEQDLDIIEYLKYKRFGYFIDVGATDGINISNTYFL